MTQKHPFEDTPDATTPEWSEQDVADARAFGDIFPHLVEDQLTGEVELVPTRGPGHKIPKRQVTLRLDPDVIDHFKRGGKGWQARLNDTLREAVGLGDAPRPMRSDDRP